MIELSERVFEGRGLTVFENERLLLGYTEMGFTSTALQRFLAGKPLLFLKQVHSDIIINQARLAADSRWRRAYPAAARSGCRDPDRRLPAPVLLRP